MNSNSNFAYAAGYIDARGSLSIARSSNGKLFIRLRIRKSSGAAVITRLAEMLELNAQIGASGVNLTISGDPLHDLMKNIWPYLSPDRKREYARLREEVRPPENSTMTNYITTTKGQGYN